MNQCSEKIHAFTTIGRDNDAKQFEENKMMQHGEGEDEIEQQIDRK